MTQQRWTLKAGSAERGTLLVVTHHAHRLDELAILVAALGYYTFAAIPEAVSGLCAVTQFDLVLVMSDVEPVDHDRLGEIALIQTRLLRLDSEDEGAIADRITARLGR